MKFDNAVRLNIVRALDLLTANECNEAHDHGMAIDTLNRILNNQESESALISEAQLKQALLKHPHSGQYASDCKPRER